jgi:hypothetical protein
MNLVKLRVYIVLFLFMLPVSVQMAEGGDYTLFISDGNEPCAPPVGSRNSDNNPIRTSDEVAKDIQRYFGGETPDLKLYNAFFSNAHISFCGKKERVNIFKALLDVIRLDAISNEAHLYDYFYMLGNKKLIKMIDIELEKENPQIVRERLRKARAAISKKYE